MFSKGSLWNIGFLQDNRIVWPQAKMLDGVARSLIDRGLAGQGLSAETRHIPLTDLAQFDAAFLCNSATPTCAVTAIGDHVFAPNEHRLGAIAAAWASSPPEPIRTPAP